MKVFRWRYRALAAWYDKRYFKIDNNVSTPCHKVLTCSTRISHEALFLRWAAMLNVVFPNSSSPSIWGEYCKPSLYHRRLANFLWTRWEYLCITFWSYRIIIKLIRSPWSFRVHWIHKIKPHESRSSSSSAIRFPGCWLSEIPLC